MMPAVGSWPAFMAEPMAAINCEFTVLSENTPVRVVWIARGDLDVPVPPAVLAYIRERRIYGDRF